MINVSPPNPPLPEGYSVVPLRTPTLPPATHTNCYLVGTADALVVDPGSPYPREQARLLERLYRLRGEGGSIAAILLTHAHRDHVAGAVELGLRLQLPITAHPQTLAQLELPPEQPRQALQDGEALIVDDDRRMQVLWTPGHAPGHVCLFETDAEVLVTGDMFSGLGTILINPADGDMRAYFDSLRALMVRHPRYLLPAHGPASADGTARLQQLLAHRIAREQAVLDALDVEVGRELPLIVTEAYPEATPLTIPLAQRSTLAHLLKLKQEGRAFERRGALATRAYLTCETNWRRAGKRILLRT